MSRFTRPALPLAAALALSLTLPMAPAMANSLSLSVTPGNTQEARLLGALVTAYAIHRDIRSGADVAQVGRNHAAALRQSGGGNLGIIRQRGSDHSADLTQRGGNNSQAILQFGRGANAHVTQYGGESGVLLQYGW